MSLITRVTTSAGPAPAVWPPQEGLDVSLSTRAVARKARRVMGCAALARLWNGRAVTLGGRRSCTSFTQPGATIGEGPAAGGTTAGYPGRVPADGDSSR